MPRRVGDRIVCAPAEAMSSSFAARWLRVPPAAPLPLALGTLPVHVGNHGDASFKPSNVPRVARASAVARPPACGSQTGRGSFPRGLPLRHKRAPKTRQPQTWDSHLTTLTYCPRGRRTGSGSMPTPLTMPIFADGSGGTGRQTARMKNLHGYSASDGLGDLDGRIPI